MSRKLDYDRKRREDRVRHPIELPAATNAADPGLLGRLRAYDGSNRFLNDLASLARSKPSWRPTAAQARAAERALGSGKC